MKVIKDLGHELVSVYDVHDELAVLDQYFPNAACFSDMLAYTDFHRAHALDYVSICSPNHLHFEHINWALARGAHVICEKPLVLDPAQLDQLVELENKFGQISTILQLRNIEAVVQLKEKVSLSKEMYDVDVRYVSARGNWYFNSWKGNDQLSGGLVTNIGIHLFDLLLWIFGPVQNLEVSLYKPQKTEGVLNLEHARVKWFLSVDEADLPQNAPRSFRQMKVNSEVIRLDEGIELLHNQSYRDILKGIGPGISEARPSIELCQKIRSVGRGLV
jgi:UDP-N-acetyl-2-amino-2-deoxyglucuronate dehydrogenase